MRPGGVAAPVLAVPELSLVVLVGISGSGKSTFARRHFRPTQVLSSDVCRGLVADDENDQAATPAAFDVLHHIAAARLRGGLLTVVDATSVKREDRAGLVQLARDHDVLPVAIVLDVPESLAVARNAARTDRDITAAVIRRQRAELRRGMRGLSREGFRKVHVLDGAEQVDAATLTYEKQYNDRRDDAGPFDVIGDVHGCRVELEQLLGELGYALHRDDAGRPVDAVHPAGRRAVFLGDLVDRGPDTPGVLRLAMGMVAAGHALAVPGNHEDKLVRALRGRPVTISHGLETTLAQLQGETEQFRTQVAEFCYGLVSHYVLDGGDLVVAHAGLKQSLQGRSSARVRDFALYGESTGETDEFGLPVRYPWAQEYRGRATVLYGHTPVPEPEWVNGTLCLDTGCVFGGRLTALRYPERELVGVRAARTYYEPARPFLTAADRPAPEAAEQRDPQVLDVEDVLGKRVVQTRHAGRVTVREENAAAAIEVMSPLRPPAGAAAVPAADDEPVGDQLAARPARAPRGGLRPLPGGGRRAGRVPGEAHGLARRGAGAPHRRQRRGGPAAGAARRGPQPDRAGVLRRPRGDPGVPGPPGGGGGPRRPVRRARDGLGAAGRRAAPVVGEGR